jgi:hypothetical protein
MRLFEMTVKIAVEGDYSDQELEAYCEDLDTADVEGVAHDAIRAALDNTSLGNALEAGTATMEVGEE